MAELLVRVGLLLLLSVTACTAKIAPPSDAAVPVEPPEPGAGPSEPPPPRRTECQWKAADELCVAGSLCPSITAGVFNCQEYHAPIALPGIDGQMRPRLLLAGQTYSAAEVGFLGRFEGKTIHLEEVNLPSLWEREWTRNSLVFLAGDEPALVTGSWGVGLARLGGHQPEVLVPGGNSEIILDDVLPDSRGGFWFLFGQSGTPSRTPDYRSRLSLSLGRYAAGQLQPSVELLPVGPRALSRLGPTPLDPLVVAIELPDSDGGAVTRPLLFGPPDRQPIRLTASSGTYVDSAVGLPDGAIVAVKSVTDGSLSAHLTGTDGVLGPGLELFGPSEQHNEGCMRVSDPSYYAGDDRLHCGGSLVDKCHFVGRRVETLPVMAHGGRALFAAVVLDIDQDTISGSRTQYSGDMPPRCGMYERVSADRSVAHLVIEEVGVGAGGLEIPRAAELLLSDWHRPFRFFGRSGGGGAIVTLDDADNARALVVVLGE